MLSWSIPSVGENISRVSKKQTDRVPCDEKGTVEWGCCANSELKRGQGAERTVGAPPYSRGGGRGVRCQHDQAGHGI